MHRLPLPEALVIGLFVLCAIRAMTIPTPLLSDAPREAELVLRAPETDETSLLELSERTGTVRVESVAPYGCIRITIANGASIGPVCNRRLHCFSPVPSPTFPSRFFVSRLSTTGEYYAETGSACDSGCCDMLGMRFSRDGKRLDDGLLQRIYMRLGPLGITLLIVGFLCSLLRVLGRRWLAWRLVTLLGFASAAIILWRQP